MTIASTKTGEIIGDYECKATAGVIFSDVFASDYDVVSVIGGSSTNDHLWENQELQDYLKQAYTNKVLVTGICSGTVTVAKRVYLLEEKQLAIQRCTKRPIKSE